jgi:hypothetical protein
MTSVLGLSMPKIGISKDDITSPKNLALGGIAATSLVGGGVIGAMRGNPLKGLAIGGAIAAVALGASLIGNASASYRDGYCDSYYDADCDYPGTRPRYDPYPGGYDPGYRDDDWDGGREDYPSGGEYYPGGATSPGDDY